MNRQARQTSVSARGYLPYPLNPPYYINRTEEYQKRVFEYARNYFSPAEMGDLTRLEIFFVPQEAERVKRNLRRKGDFDYANDVHPSNGRANAQLRGFAAQAAGTPAAMPDGMRIPEGGAPDLDNFRWRDGQVVTSENEIPENARLRDDAPRHGRLYSELSFLRRVELFIASMFVFDCAHGLLAHLHEEVISLTSHGTQADEVLLKQIARNLRGYAFRRLLRTTADGNNVDVARNPGAARIPNKRDEMAIDRAAPRRFQIRDGPTPELHTYRPAAALNGLREEDRFKDFTLEDLADPLSSTELAHLQNEGWLKRGEKYYAPTRYPTSLAQAIDNRRTTLLRAVNENVMDANRAMGIYPVAFLTNTTIADDACAARLIEHCGSETIDPQMFSWGMRRQVFMPLETDVADVYRFQDLKTYDELHDALNAFSNGLFAGISMTGLWSDYLRPRLSSVLTQVPLNQLRPFKNVIKHIEMPAVQGEMRHTAGQAEIIRLYNKVDDILSKINQWFTFGGDFSKVSYEEYRRADPDDPEAIIGNAPFAGGWGQRALGLSKCGPDYEPTYFAADPDLTQNARNVPAYVQGAEGGMVLNPAARFEKCAPRAPRRIRDADVQASRPSRVLQSMDSRMSRKRRSRRR